MNREQNASLLLAGGEGLVGEPGEDGRIDEEDYSRQVDEVN